MGVRHPGRRRRPAHLRLPSLLRGLGLLLPFCASALWSQTLPFKTYSIADGLPSNDIEAIAQDSRGFMWFGTTDGVSVFDGVGFTNISTAEGLPENFVSQIFEDRVRPGVMWLLCRGRVVRMSGGAFRTFDQTGTAVHGMHQDRAGRVWCGTDDGLLLIGGDSVSRWNTAPFDGLVFDVNESSDSVLWIARPGAMVRYSLSTGSSARVPLPLVKQGKYWGMAGDPAGNLMLMADYLYQLRDTGFVARYPGKADVPWLATDRSGNLWGAGYGGLWRFSIGRFPRGKPERYTVANGLPDSLVRSIYCDREDNLWIGGRDHGVSLLVHGAMREFSVGEFRSSVHRRFGASDRFGHVWVIASDSLFEFWRDEDDRWSKFRHELPLKRERRFNLGSVFVDHRNRLCLTTVNSTPTFYVFDIGDETPGREGHATLVPVSSRRLPFTHADDFPITMIVDHRDRIWVSFGLDGIFRIDPSDSGGRPGVFNDASGVPTNYIRELFEDREGNIWGAHFTQGVVKISPDGAVRRYTTAGGLPENSCWAIAQAPDGRMLIGTENGGLAVIDGDSVRVVSGKGGLETDNIQSIAVDSTGRVWLGTSIGLLREKAPGTMDFVTDERLLGPGVGAIGMAGRDFVWGLPASNLTLYDLRSDLVPPVSPPVSLRTVRVNGVDRPLADTLDLAHDQNTIEVGFAGIDFLGGGPVYRYRLKGADDRWHGPTRNRSILFGHLDPGSYRFEVEAVNVAGLRSPSPAGLVILVAPPYWRTWWFLLGVVIALGASGGWAVRSRTRRILREQRAAEEFSRKLIESQELERKRLAGELHDELGQELLVMINRAQMGIRADNLDNARRHFDEVSKAGARAIEEVRSMAFNLRPYHLEQLGLSESIRVMVEKVAASVAIRFTAEIDPIDGVLPAEQEIHLFRIVQECVNNVVKHSAASTAVVRIRSTGGALSIAVIDDGRGIGERGSGRSKEGFGLPGLTERARLLGGTVSISTPAGGGTAVTVSIPPGGQPAATGKSK